MKVNYRRWRVRFIGFSFGYLLVHTAFNFDWRLLIALLSLLLGILCSLNEVQK